MSTSDESERRSASHPDPASPQGAPGEAVVPSQDGAAPSPGADHSPAGDAADGTATATSSGSRGSSRRGLLIGGMTAGAGLVGMGMGAGLARSLEGRCPAHSAGPAPDPAQVIADRSFPFHGPHQAGIATEPTARVLLVGLDLREETDREAIIRMMRVLTDDAERLTAGRAPIADPEPELALRPAGLTITLGFGPNFVERAGMPAPSWLKPLPPYSIDRLEDRWSDGDLFLQINADEPTTVAHAARMLMKDARSFTTVRWRQAGFRNPAMPAVPSGSMRNLFGQVDGTSNPRPGTELFDRTVWIPEGPWAGGTSLVLRRITMNLDTWDELDAPGREESVGRRLTSGAPLTGEHELDEPDFSAMSENGFPVIAEFSHMRAARGEGNGGKPMQHIVRRAFNYDDPSSDPEQLSDSGLLFLSFQADVDAQYVPIQERLAKVDLLNQWTVPVGSSVFAIPPGCGKGEFIGESLLG